MSRYITTKNKKNTTERLELKKYNPILRRVTVHKEIKESASAFLQLHKLLRHGKESSSITEDGKG